MPPTLTEPEKFREQKASRAVCKDCDWEYDPPEGCSWLVVWAYAAIHTSKHPHKMSFV